MPDAHDRLVALIAKALRHFPTYEHEKRAEAATAVLVDPANRATVLEAMGAEQVGWTGAARDLAPLLPSEGPQWVVFTEPVYVFPTEEASDA